MKLTYRVAQAHQLLRQLREVGMSAGGQILRARMAVGVSVDQDLEPGSGRIAWMHFCSLLLLDAKNEQRYESSARLELPPKLEFDFEGFPDLCAGEGILIADMEIESSRNATILQLRASNVSFLSTPDDDRIDHEASIVDFLLLRTGAAISQDPSTKDVLEALDGMATSLTPNADEIIQAAAESSAFVRC